jgi:hypothetical protein
MAGTVFGAHSGRRRAGQGRYVLAVEVQLDLVSELTRDWRDGDPR